jgi:hypothetical protein
MSAGVEQRVYLCSTLSIPVTTGYPKERSHNFSDCACEDFLEGVFASMGAARRYIPESLDGSHENLQWEIVDRRDSCGYYGEFGRASDGLVY